MLDRPRPTLSKNSLSSLKRFRILPCFPTMFIILLLVPLKRSSYFLTKGTPSFGSFAFLTSSFIRRQSSSSLQTSYIDARSSFLIISGVLFFLTFFATPRNYKLKKALLKFTKLCKIIITIFN